MGYELQGHDPFDALRGRRVPALVRRSRLARQLIIQARKRSSFDLAGILGVEPFVMAKAAGCFLSAAARDLAAGSGDVDEVSRIAGVLLSDPTVARVGDGRWGYEFDVQTRWAYYPACSPNVIATVFVARGFGDAGLATGTTEYLDQMHASARYVARELFCSEGFFRYTPTSDTLVHNANLLAAGLVAASGALRGDEQAVALAVRAALRSVQAQGADGSWGYGDGAHLGWIDNFHTAYDLDGLLAIWLASAEPAVHDALRAGCDYWVDSFFSEQGAPAYYASGGAPFDIHSAGTAIDVAARLAAFGLVPVDLARRVLAWTRDSLVDPATGNTWYRRSGSRTDRRHFVRWGDAHFALGESSVRLADAGVQPLLEDAIISAVSR